MYQSGQKVLHEILELVATCPKEFQEKCFELLLSGYVQREVGTSTPPPAFQAEPSGPNQGQAPAAESHVPAAVLPRFKNTAKRLGISTEKLESLFDFSVDPFALHAVTIPGKNNAEKTRQVALLAASRSYLAAGSWSADWQEVKALCVDHNCYGGANHGANLKNLKKGASALFKAVDPGKPIECR